jgi:hypothetical protein
VSARFSTFLRQEDPTLYDEYRMEIFKSSKAGDDTLSGKVSDSIVIRDPIPTQPIS